MNAVVIFWGGIMVTVDDINEKRQELEIMEREYLDNTPPCNNDKCGLYRPNQKGHCCWSVLLEECGEYIPA